jgi:hypothetical protein
MCYVRGCKEPTALVTWHKQFGEVVSCACHNPNLHGYGRQRHSVDNRRDSTEQPGGNFDTIDKEVKNSANV